MPFHIKGPFIYRQQLCLSNYYQLGSHSLGTLGWNDGIKQLGANRRAMFLNGMPFVCMFGGVVFLRNCLDTYLSTYPHYGGHCYWEYFEKEGHTFGIVQTINLPFEIQEFNLSSYLNKMRGDFPLILFCGVPAANYWSNNELQVDNLRAE